MAENSKIAWTDHTFNPWIGCTRVSPGCQNCYAENQVDRRYHWVKWGPGQPRRRTKTWNDPVKWNRQAEKEGRRFKVFSASLADWLDEEVPHQWREDLCRLIEDCPSLDWLMLTKRIERYEMSVPPSWLMAPLPNVWLGVTAENQEYWNLRVPLLVQHPAAVRWVSYEPALGPIDMSQTGKGINELLDWLIIGGESAQMEEARPFHYEWAREAIAQCRKFEITPFVKQVGPRPLVTLTDDNNPAYRGGMSFGMKDKAGADPAEWPEDLRIREFPTPRVLL